MSFEPGVEAAAASAGGGDGGQEQGFDGDMAPVDLDQAMGSFSPEWANGTVRVALVSWSSSRAVVVLGACSVGRCFRVRCHFGASFDSCNQSC